MGKVVLKFGGTSVGDVAKIKATAEQAIREKEKGHEVVVVVSAMGKSTDHLVNLAEQINPKAPSREMDMLLSTGEQVTIALLAMAIEHEGHAAISYTGWQAGLVTEEIHGNARIQNILTTNVGKALDEGKIVVVAGFQGLSENGEITTLGRGGSDTTAVALAAALGAEKCSICTDVVGVYTSDPRYISEARKLAEIDYDEMLELANLGAGVLHPRAVEYAKNFNIPLEVRGAHVVEVGTMIKEGNLLETKQIVRGVAFDDKIARIRVSFKSVDKMNVACIFTKLAEEHVNVDIIVQSIGEEAGPSAVSFSLKEADLEEALRVLEQNKAAIGYHDLVTESGLAKVSIVGSGMVSNPGVAAQMFTVLRNAGISVRMISTSEIKVSVVVPEVKMLEAAEVCHQTFDV
ncbi:aspartate kinase [Brochothrix thermosphacta]|uniref:Aspartokinase n=1 Tax=Brochothrix thermosphacta TaxID=2756 RepID=A0A2X0QJI1_BROTH|nr:aspartate kinase [Brochothrix thermosphacta]ANZ95748.1 aspartate kinase [Brochothrix thermosphacta]EUJ35744.1 aspartate kinase [Brochothrix thermosphacta DSM 20171 = FSL F6-1036]MDO7863549.1 aspartate kinase [Brochothrix thermosphacta]ODJ50792.1 aspartate kinase [Brochothrix thermosphacta DSM 20171 = FSL F6-1036]ODJ59676.1 aspartate kinase [Brochothrix thermosphacta]